MAANYGVKRNDSLQDVRLPPGPAREYLPPRNSGFVEKTMADNSLDRFIAQVRRDWGPLGSSLVQRCRAGLAALTLADPREDWLAALQAERPASRELHRDAAHGFLLLAHAEPGGLYRPPHDHGRSWVVYGVQSGTLEVVTYAKVPDEDGHERLVARETGVLRPGEARAYLPGDVHDTRSLGDGALLLRFTERDLGHEDRVGRRMTRYEEREGEWRAPARAP